MQAGFALKDVTLTKATVIEPMPVLAGGKLKKEYGDDALTKQPKIPFGRSDEECQLLNCCGPDGCHKPSHADAHTRAADCNGAANRGAGGGCQAGVAVPRRGDCSETKGDEQVGKEGQPESADEDEDARMKMVFDDRDRAQNSDDHLRHVAEQCAPSFSLNRPGPFCMRM